MSKRILLVNGNYEDGTVGGTQTFTASLARGLLRRGYVVAVLCQGDVTERLEIDGILIYRLRHPRLESLAQSPIGRFLNQCLAIYNPFVRSGVRHVLRDFNPQICHIQMLRRLTPALIRVVTEFRDISIVQTVHELFSLWNFDAFQYIDSPGKVHSKRSRLVVPFKVIHRRLSHKVHAVCAPSSFALRSYLNDGYFKNVERFVIPNAVDFPREGPASELSQRLVDTSNDGVCVFLYIGRLEYYKGIPQIIQAFSELLESPFKLLIAGSGVMENAIVQLSESDPRVTYLGPVFGSTKDEAFRAANVLLCPSTFGETFGLVIVEAYAFAMPVIISADEALIENVEPGKTGLVVEVGSVEALKTAMLEVAATDVRRRMYVESARKALEYDMERFLDRQISVYETVLTANGR